MPPPKPPIPSNPNGKAELPLLTFTESLSTPIFSLQAEQNFASAGSSVLHLGQINFCDIDCPHLQQKFDPSGISLLQ
jgi:hypothetical protein